MRDWRPKHLPAPRSQPAPSRRRRIAIPEDAGSRRREPARLAGLDLVRRLKQLNPEMGILILAAPGAHGARLLDVLRGRRGLVYLVIADAGPSRSIVAAS